jgi:hypothetical protein
MIRRVTIGFEGDEQAKVRSISVHLGSSERM